MTNKTLTILAIAAVVMAGWAILQSRLAQRPSEAMFRSAPLIQGFDPATIAKITIAADNGRQDTTLHRKDGQFYVAQKDGYPANIVTINRLLNSCLDIRSTQRITDNPANHHDLGVSEATARCTVRFFDADGNELTGMILSNTQHEQNTAYARRTDDDTTYLIQNPPWIQTAAVDYINRTLLEVDRNNIRQVTVRSPEGEYVLTSPDGNVIELEDMPDGKQFKGTDYRSVFGALSRLQAEDVMAADNAPDGLVFDRSVVCVMEDTTVYTVMLARQNGTTYATLTAYFVDTAPVKISRDETPEELRKKEAKLLAMDAAEAFAARHDGWIYTIASAKADDLTTSLDALVEPIADPDDAHSDI